jgi:hypothetical protein
MSARNGDKARFQTIRKRKLHRRQRIRALMARVPKRTDEEHPVPSTAATLTRSRTPRDARRH